MKDWLIFLDQTQSAIDQFGYVISVFLLVIFAGFYLVRKYIESSLNYKFDAKLQSFKTDQEKLLKKAQYDIDRQLDRSVHFNKNEFEIIPEAWSKIQDAEHHVYDLFSLISFPDLDSYKEDELNNFLDKSGLSEEDVNKIKRSIDKNTGYSNAIRWKLLMKAKNKCLIAQEYLDKTSIFMPQDIERLFIEFINILQGVCIAEHSVMQRGGKMYNDMTDSTKLNLTTDGRMKKEQLHRIIREKLSNNDLSQI